MSWGGSPRCETCGQAVYHAEQALGPARKVYHKLCLKCLQCGKRVDPGSLVEHDSQPYCARCHTQLFGTRDLRHANVNVTTPTASPARTPSRANYQTPLSPPSSSRPLAPRPVPPQPDFYTPPPLNSPEASMRTPTTPRDPDTPITRPNFRDARPIVVGYAGRTQDLDDRGLMKRGESPRSKVGERVGGDDMCVGCGKRVYMAEQVYAIGQKWHKACLRCTACKSTIDPSKVSDRDSKPYCKNCYAKEFGPGGIMGKR